MLNAMKPRNPNDKKYRVYRGEQFLGEYVGSDERDRVGNYINFYQNKNIQQGDILICSDTNCKYEATDVKFEKDPAKYFLRDNLAYYNVYYIKDSDKKPTYNIHANQSAVLINSPHANVTMSNLTQEAQRLNLQDNPEFKELMNLLNELISEKQPIKKGCLSKFSSFLTNYGQLAACVAQIIFQIML